MANSIIGWDIGGAHVKAALLNEQGQVVKVSIKACPLWKGLNHLEKAVLTIMTEFSVQHCSHVITMTGELVDLFDSREQGVNDIVKAMRVYLNSFQIIIYAGQYGFISSTEVNQRNCLSIASANWLASACFAASKVETGLFVDIGSTTTDILCLNQRQVLAQGFTDYQRLQTRELVYTGIVRTAVMAVADEAVFNGQKMGLMAEYFATMADVYRLTGELNEAHDLTETADGEAKTVLASARRLSRMTGYDFNKQDMALWLSFANEIRRQQLEKISNACQLQLQRLGSDAGTLVGAGIGRFLLENIAGQLKLEYRDFNELVPQAGKLSGVDSADCAPAVAVAGLALQQQLV